MHLTFLTRRRQAALLTTLLVALLAAPLVAPDTSGQSADAAAVRSVQARPADSLVDAVGVQTHLGYPGTPYMDVERTKQALVRLGVRHVRDNLYSNRPEMYAAMREIASAGIRFDLIMGKPKSPDSPEKLIETLRDNLSTGVVESIEGANEWNLRGGFGWVGELRAHHKRLWKAAKAEPVTADLPILAPSLGMRSGYGQLGNLSKFSDYGNAHNYPGGLQPSAFIDQVTAAARSVVPRKPVIFTESGYHNAMNSGSGHHPVLPRAAGEYVPRMLLEHYLRGTDRLYFYELADQSNDTRLRLHEMNFGLIRNDFTRKPAYLALRNLLRLAADPGPTFRAGSLSYDVAGAPHDLREVLLQKRDGSFLVLLWRDVSIYDRIKEALLPATRRQVTVRFAQPADVTLFEPARSSAALDSWRRTNAVRVPLDGSVVALQVLPRSG